VVGSVVTVTLLVRVATTATRANHAGAFNS
jgi:hypothetical protein